jgi:hypothetical protein
VQIQVKRNNYFCLELKGTVQPDQIDLRVVHWNPFRLNFAAKFGTFTVDSVNGTLVKDKMYRFQDEYAHFSFKKCPIYTRDVASAKFSTNSHETDNSVSLQRYFFIHPPL